MEKNPRIFLFGLLAIVLLLMYRAWLVDTTVALTPPPDVATRHTSTTDSLSALDTDFPTAISPNASDAPPSDAPLSASDSDATASHTPIPHADAIEARYITVTTDVLDLRIDRLGGEISYAALPQYPVTIDEPETPFTLLDDSTPQPFIAQSGIAPVDPSERAQGLPLFETKASHYTLEEDQENLEVQLTWENENGLSLVKRYRFKRNDYLIEVTQEVQNRTNRAWEGSFYGQFKRIPSAEKKRGLGARSFTGVALSSQAKRYQKVKFEEISANKIPDQSTTGGWVGMLQHYFLAVWIPPQEQPITLFTAHQSASNLHYAGFKTPVVTVAPQDTQSFTQSLYVGPKTQDTLKEIAPALERSVDYGYLFFIAEPLFWLLKNINRLIGNWGWSIIILTSLIKLAFFKLSEKSYRSMANMRQLAPKLKALKERYADDKQRLNMETMELYKKEKINPLGGCLPIVIQMPVFISLYWMLLETVELRQAPFMFWIQDLSVRDPFFILPLIMGASMLLQQRLNPPPTDPAQQKVMMFMPIMFTGMFLFFPAGLVLYWVINNILSIAQQWYIVRRVEQGG